ncbi:nitric oxide reductase NorQ protein [Mycolicibacterium sp. BK556]|uniref:CbbQ/NirQ/NorQ/GpvN family protein n=1 Tax=unclassified Mycolicibacterium TaxID=2636767 RepID=UPI001615013F|nr:MULTISPECIES: CbbQ/NirQ/NorQ/GpvN family protein [unclassified Mycolicibacterium]MBB3600621.1 nitric oxide reductase NorQ protein [Mycolicibacterium sp. BK556]MBB3630374.1 nitric oxide reductase NorQ protein [Mycolicibacterium sp. BK607]
MSVQEFERVSADRQSADVPYYLPIGNEVEVFRAAWDMGLPVMLKGPTGCGKTRLVEHMAATLQIPLHTVSCHEDMTASDLLGRFLLIGGETRWVDGPLTTAAREGGICYLDEIVEARQDAVVAIHSLADHRRELSLERLGGQTIKAANGFQLVVSYNPGYQSILKDMKPSTRQRMIAIELEYPDPALEAEIVRRESGHDGARVDDLLRFAQAVRKVAHPGMREVCSTRTLVAASQLMRAGLAFRDATIAAIAGPLSDDQELRRGLIAMIDSYAD